jgi:hypothetical protein
MTLDVDVGEWSASHPGRFNRGTLWIGGWVGPIDGVARTVVFLDIIRRSVLATAFRRQHFVSVFTVSFKRQDNGYKQYPKHSSYNIVMKF